MAVWPKIRINEEHYLKMLLEINIQPKMSYEKSFYLIDIKLVVCPKYPVESLKLIISQVLPIWPKMCKNESLNLKLV